VTSQYTPLLFREEPAPTRPVYDIPPVIVSAPRWPRLHTLAARLVGRRHPGAGSGCAAAEAARADADHAPVT
jgi:hypothetical protein